MITVEVFNRDNRYAITTTGHAEYAPLGEDIVCAGVSTLCYALANHILDTFADNEWIVLDVSFDEKQARNNIDILDESGNKIAENLFKMISEQLKDLAESYPKNIKVVEKKF